jgi:gluconate 5-dehydrogenase
MILEAFRLDRQVALITGGGTGLGLGIAQCMVDAGAQVVIVGRRETVLREAVGQLGPAASFELHDVTQTDRVVDLVQRVEGRVGPISILVNNAGIHLKKPAVDTTEEELLGVFNTHVTGAFALTRAVAPGMIQRGDGSVLFIASMASLFGIPQVSAYTVAKSAYLGLVNSLTVELSPRGVRVNAIAPGWIDSQIMRNAVEGDPERKNRILTRTPMQRFGDPRDIGHAAVYLSSSAASFVTGTVLPVDGGAAIGF